jgi:dethiobiotin synthetase
MSYSTRDEVESTQNSTLETQGSVLVTGTDTGVGKTLVSCALLHAFRAQGRTAIGMKPVASGCIELNGQLVSEDAASLLAASSPGATLDMINPYAFAPAIAPHIAAREVGATIRIDRILSTHSRLRERYETVVIEGVGGFRVPLNEREDTADLAVHLKAPVVLVVGMRLGCLNHALLTAEAIAARGLALAGWVANEIDPNMPAFAENVAALKERIPRLLGVFEFNSGIDPLAVARRLSLEPISSIST